MTKCPHCGHVLANAPRKQTLGITPRQKELLDFIRSFSKRKGHAPSTLEMTDALGSKSTANTIRLLRELQSRGQIDVGPRRARSVVVLGDAA